MTASLLSECGRPLTHRHPPDLKPERVCEPGIVARCAECLWFWAPCTATPMADEMFAVLEQLWICWLCIEEAGYAS